MKVINSLLAILAATLVTVEASVTPHGSRLARSHQNLAREVLPPNSLQKRCQNSSSTAKPNTTVATKKHAAPKPAVALSSSGLITVSSKNCGHNGATEQVTPTTGPNGDLDWLNCGINAGGWTPPFVQISDIKTKSLSAAVQEAGTPFQACTAYVSLFEQYGAQHGYPGILLASFAMQESSCNPSAVGGNGEQGLMQLTKDKCGDAPGGNCQDPDYNIKTGAAFFASLLADNKGSLLLSIGRYNGWFQGMTYSDATAAGNGPDCKSQNNLDYVFQFLNGWCQNIDAYNVNPPLGKYFNLNKCS